MKPLNERLERTESSEQVEITGPDGKPRTITVTVPAWRDPANGEIYLDADSIALLDKARARHRGVLAPQQLTDLRQRLGLTQQQIAADLQIGQKTWTRWETGREVPSRSLNLLLVALYEGKIDLAYLRAKRTPAEFWPGAPALRMSGWDELFTSGRALEQRWFPSPSAEAELSGVMRRVIALLASRRSPAVSDMWRSALPGFERGPARGDVAPVQSARRDAIHGAGRVGESGPSGRAAYEPVRGAAAPSPRLEPPILCA